MHVIVGGYPRHELESNPEDRNNEVDHESDKPRQEVIQNSEDFGSLLNTNAEKAVKLPLRPPD